MNFWCRWVDAVRINQIFYIILLNSVCTLEAVILSHRLKYQIWAEMYICIRILWFNCWAAISSVNWCLHSGSWILADSFIQAILNLKSIPFLLQVCVQMWSRSQSDICRRKISILLTMCASALPPSHVLYNYVLKWVESQSPPMLNFVSIGYFLFHTYDHDIAQL